MEGISELGGIKIASASTPSANKPAKDFTLVHTVQLKPMIKAHFSGRMVSSGISDVVIASVHSQKTRLKSLVRKMMMIMMMMIIIITKNHLLVNEKRRRRDGNASLKVHKQGKSFQLHAIRKLCQDACQRLMLYPYITATMSIFYYLMLHSGIGH